MAAARARHMMGSRRASPASASAKCPHCWIMAAMKQRKQTVAPTRTQAEPPPGPPPFANMVWIPGGEFAMGSDKHYPEERPVHRVCVDGFWMDPTPVTNARFSRFVDATSHTTFAELPPKPEDYPGAL